MLAIAMNTTPYTYLGASSRSISHPKPRSTSPLSVVALTSLSPRMLPLLLSATRRHDGPGRPKGGAHHWSGVE